MRECAELIARNAMELHNVDWRDLERILREVFEGIGFETVLTRSAKDGGFDLELSTISHGEKAVYLVEVKHWSDPDRPGRGVLKDFVKVVVSREATKGLLLSSSGFTNNIYSGVSEVERQHVRLGGRSKIIGLCRTYYRLGTEIWLADDTLPQLLFEETV